MFKLSIHTKPLNDAPIGRSSVVNAPWGAIENARVVTMQEVNGSRVDYAFVYRPKHNHGVRVSVFRVRD